LDDSHALESRISLRWIAAPLELYVQQSNSQSCTLYDSRPFVIESRRLQRTFLAIFFAVMLNTPAAGEIIHYMMEGISGAIYGVAAEITPLASPGEGLAFGTSVLMVATRGLWRSLPLAIASQAHA
jgi:hypothetical protein